MFYLYAGVLLPEMVTSMVLLQLKAPGVIHASRSVPVLEEILDILDTYNKLAPGLDRDDKEDLAWPGVWSKWEGLCTVIAGIFSFWLKKWKILLLTMMDLCCELCTCIYHFKRSSYYFFFKLQIIILDISSWTYYTSWMKYHQQTLWIIILFVCL